MSDEAALQMTFGAEKRVTLPSGTVPVFEWLSTITMHELDRTTIMLDASVPETAEQLADDLDERVRAMTLHHLDVALVPFAVAVPCAEWRGFMQGYTLRVHPDTWRRVDAEMQLARALGVPYRGEQRIT